MAERRRSPAKLLLFGPLLVSPALVAARGPTPAAAGARAGSKLESELAAAFRARTAKVASVAVVSDSGFSFARVWGGGFGSLGGAATDNTVFRAASLRKPVLAFIALLLVKEGRLEVDRPFATIPGPPLTRHPDWADLADDARWKATTAKHVLSHRTGFPNWRRELPDRRLRILFDPETRFSYSGEGYRLLQHVVERIVGAAATGTSSVRRRDDITRRRCAMTEGNAEGTGRIDALRAAAEGNDARAQLELANRLTFGEGVARDPEEAYRWMRKAAEAGVAEAQSKVGYFLTTGLGVAPDPKGAIRWFLRGLKGGYAKAGYNLGEAYGTGRHVTFSPRRAWFFFSKAVELGQEAAHYGLARLCYRGQGVPKDVGKSMEHLRRALRADDSGAIVEMGRVYRAGDAGPEDLAEAEARALARHRPGDLASLRVLFELRREATAPPPPPAGYDAVVAELNRRQALRREKEQPAAAAFREGVDLYWGHGVPKDVPRALALLESAAGDGNADAARFLALAYEGDGDGVPKSRESANRWWGEAARLGDAHGSYVVGAALLDAASTVEDEARGRALLEHAAALGSRLRAGISASSGLGRSGGRTKRSSRRSPSRSCASARSEGTTEPQ